MATISKVFSICLDGAKPVTIPEDLISRGGWPHIFEISTKQPEDYATCVAEPKEECQFDPQCQFGSFEDQEKWDCHCFAQQRKKWGHQWEHDGNASQHQKEEGAPCRSCLHHWCGWCALWHSLPSFQRGYQWPSCVHEARDDSSSLQVLVWRLPRHEKPCLQSERPREKLVNCSFTYRPNPFSKKHYCVEKEKQLLPCNMQVDCQPMLSLVVSAKVTALFSLGLPGSMSFEHTVLFLFSEVWHLFLLEHSVLPMCFVLCFQHTVLPWLHHCRTCGPSPECAAKPAWAMTTPTRPGPCVHCSFFVNIQKSMVESLCWRKMKLI